MIKLKPAQIEETYLFTKTKPNEQVIVNGPVNFAIARTFDKHNNPVYETVTIYSEKNKSVITLCSNMVGLVNIKTER